MKLNKNNCSFNNNVQIKKKKSFLSIIINKIVLNETPEEIKKKIDFNDIVSNTNNTNNMIIDQVELHRENKENRVRRSPSPQKSRRGFSVLSPTNRFDDVYGFCSPLNLNASQFNTKNNYTPDV